MIRKRKRGETKKETREDRCGNEKRRENARRADTRNESEFDENWKIRTPEKTRPGQKQKRKIMKIKPKVEEKRGD